MNLESTHRTVNINIIETAPFVVTVRLLVTRIKSDPWHPLHPYFAKIGKSDSSRFVMIGKLVKINNSSNQVVRKFIVVDRDQVKPYQQ